MSSSVQFSSTQPNPTQPNPTQPNPTQQRQGLLFADKKTEKAFVAGYVELVNRFLRRGNPWGGYALSTASSPSAANVRGIKMFGVGDLA
jgi:hypothetical protein